MMKIRIPPPWDLIQMHQVGRGFAVVHITRWPWGAPKTFRVLAALDNPWWPVPPALNDN
jgi:hypothetical protein